MNTAETLERIVTILPPKPEAVERTTRRKKLRVAAYCRVSTEQEEQQSSYEAQINYYTEKINGNAEWTLVDIFADEGITGTSDKKRTDFMRLMKLCEQGKVDLVLTKSISRFARNTLDCLKYIRMLKERGIPIIFEKENINTMEMASEMIISLLSSFAQAESESLSKNVTWGVRQRFRSGKVTFQYSRFFGYRKGPDGQPEIIPEQAEVVRRIFDNFLSGYSINRIKEELEREGVPSSTGKPEWSVSALRYMLKNEKYIGDALLQKTYTADFLSKKIRKNNGELEQVYVKNNHPAIISREVFHQVQEELARRAGKRKVSQKRTKSEKGRYASKFALSELLVCGDCGAHYRRVTWARGGKKKIVWRCMSRLEFGTKYCRNSPTMDEDKLQEAVTRALARLTGDKADVASTVQNSVLAALGACNDGFDEAAALRRLDEAKRETLDLMDLSAKSHDEEHFAKKFQELRDEMASLQAAVEKHRKQRDNAEALGEQAQAVMDALESETFDWTEYNDTAVRHLVSKITVVRFDRIRIQFKNGMEVEECVL